MKKAGVLLFAMGAYFIPGIVLGMIYGKGSMALTFWFCFCWIPISFICSWLNEDK